MRHLVPVIAVAASLVAASSLVAQGPWPTKGWPTATPAAVGLDETVLAAFDADIASGKYGYVDSMLVIRRGQLAWERYYTHDYDRIYGAEAKARGALNPNDWTGPYNYYNPWWHPYYRRGDLHSLQSVTKTVTSVLIGIATARKEFPPLDTPVLSFFDERAVANVDDRKRRITLRHLLTMTAGLEWEEDVPYADPKNDAVAMEAGFDWIAYTLNRPMVAEPGTTFKYSSGATQLLSHIFTAATGADIEEYAVRHLFGPLGIERHYWKRTPKGLVDTEGGLYLHSRDVAKIAYLFLRNGVWEGRPLVDPAWVETSVAPHVAAGAGGVRYGYKWWLYPYGAEGRLAFAGSGFGGQRPIVIPEHDLVLVYTGWNILPDRPSLSARVAIDRVLAALADTPRRP